MNHDIALKKAVLDELAWEPRRLAWHDVDAGYDIQVRVEKGWMTLSGQVTWPFQNDGTVRSPHERQVAAAPAWAAPGVTAVENNLSII